MGKVYDSLTPQLIEFINQQKMFFVGTAPLAGDGHVNISPKGMDSLRVLDTRTVAYLDVTGSGVETLSHVKENGRLVIMFCAFEGKPFTLRLHGEAEVLETDHPQFNALLSKFSQLPGVRSIIRLNAARIADSCGWTVPLYEHLGTRDYYDNYAEKLGKEGLREGQLAGNMHSIDGLIGLDKPSL
ncbi:MAG: pyridoxamine 5'-phosphate oxidase family protein [Gammaproteobacteria bacterium]|nr:pyridoxamine 5'-phosphate oxidase family protein [Gammaproteobacteria bacterium]